MLLNSSSRSDEFGNIFYPPEPNDDPSSDDEFKDESKKSVPDDILWKMFKTGVSFRSLAEILKLALSIFNAENSFYIAITTIERKVT